MAKTAKRKSPPKRKPASAKSSGLVMSGMSLSGWIVAAGLGAAWAGPHFGIVPDDVLRHIPSIDSLKQMASLADTPTPRPDELAPRVKSSVPPQELRAEEPSRKPVLLPIKAETAAVVARKAEVRPSVAMPRPQARTAPAQLLAPPVPPAPVPTPFITAAIRKDTPARAPKSRPGELAIRRYPFANAPAVAYVGDLRTIRIVGVEGDWKKVEVSATGVTGWLRLHRLEPASPPEAPDARRSEGPKPAATLLREADAAGSR